MRSHNAGFLGSDQGWMSLQLVGKDYVGGWPLTDVLSFTRDVVRNEVRPSSGKIVFFAGSRKPWHAEVQSSAPWIKNYVSYEERVAA